MKAELKEVREYALIDIEPGGQFHDDNIDVIKILNELHISAKESLGFLDPGKYELKLSLRKVDENKE